MPEPKKPTQLYTVLVVSDHSQAVRKFRLTRRWLERGAWIAGAAAVASLAGLVHYFALLGSASENRVLREENAQLRSQILLVQEKVAHISATLDRVERFDAKLRTAVTELHDPEKNLALGPVQPASDPAAVPGPAPAAGDAGSSPRGTARPEGAGEPQGSAEDVGSLLASTPSAWPAHGWLTSEFGVRLDPASAERSMHGGVDIATPHGAPVIAPSDGTVVFSGVEGSYGKVLVVDHGYGVKTRYGHLSEVLVAPGDKVKRGSRIALVGNTGRSTGPHLHYEIRVNGIPENPRRFLAE
jgi:murein DD-endopeptidase MepM/ murein hydrolase activator NlpD